MNCKALHILFSVWSVRLSRQQSVPVIVLVRIRISSILHVRKVFDNHKIFLTTPLGQAP